MNPVSHFFWFAAESAQVGIGFCPGFAMIGAVGLVASIAAAAHNPEPLRGKRGWLLVPLSIPIAILVYGMTLPYSGPVGTAPAWRSDILLWIFCTHLPVGIFLVILFRRNPIVPLGLSAFLVWYSWGAMFVMAMRVTNTWL